MGPLAEIAHDAGYGISGSDLSPGLITEQLAEKGVNIHIGDQNGDFLEQIHSQTPLDMFAYTSALPADHPELLRAQSLGIKTAKRDELLSHIIKEKNLKLIAVAGTHGKTTTTGMVVWLAKYFNIPISYSVGTTLSWGPSGTYTPGSEYFVYECDEFDRNFLSFDPYVSIITSLEHDHPDTYPTEEDYFTAFSEFVQKSSSVVTWQQFDNFIKGDNVSYINQISPLLKLRGEHNRRNASLILSALEKFGIPAQYAAEGLNRFPGTNRRFEQVAPGVYSDYGHTPSEVAATLQMAREGADQVVLVYQPHQNIRQHEIRDQYNDEIFKDAELVYWLPTYLSRERPDLEILSPEELTKNLTNTSIKIADLNDQLLVEILGHAKAGKLVIAMGAGSIDGWLRGNL